MNAGTRSRTYDLSIMAGRIDVLTREWDRANSHESFPTDRIAALADTGALTAFVTLDDADALTTLAAALRQIGGADLSLGRIFEGHVNAIQLVHVYGNDAQRLALAEALATNRLFGVWNTERDAGVTLTREADQSWSLAGAKIFATGAGHLDRVLISARTSDGDKQLVLVDIADHAARADNRAWQVRGMRGTQSGMFDFTGMRVDDGALIGQPGDYEREPRFSAGAWRFTAVQLGAIQALLRHWRAHLITAEKASDPIQRVRFGACVAATRSASLWVARAAQVAQQDAPEAIPVVLMTRGLVEDAALMTMEGAARAIGTASFRDDSRVDRITRDLGLYLRQPVPDQARERAAAAWIEADCWGEDRWW